MIEDRTVHAFSTYREVVRYDKQGKWYLECGDLPRIKLTLAEAVLQAHEFGWVANLDLPGGKRFDAEYRRLARERR